MWDTAINRSKDDGRLGCRLRLRYRHNVGRAMPSQEEELRAMANGRWEEGKLFVMAPYIDLSMGGQEGE